MWPVGGRDGGILGGLGQAMKKSLIIPVNIGFVLLAMAFVLLYTRNESTDLFF